MRPFYDWAMCSSTRSKSELAEFTPGYLESLYAVV